MPSLPKLILDTNVCGKLLSPAYRGDVEQIKRHFSRYFDLVVSPQSFVELLNCIQGGDGTHFSADKDRLRFLVGGGAVDFLPFPVAFALKTVLGVDDRSPKFFGPSHFMRWFKVVINAKDRTELVNWDVRLPGDSKRQRRGFRLEELIRQHEDGISQHRAQMEKAIGGKGILPTPDMWAAGLADSLGHKLAPQRATLLGTRLDAAYRYAKELCSIVANGLYNFDKHRGDWIDWQQLFYLCDPNIFLLTDDKGLRTRVETSAQGAQILDLRDFLKRHGVTVRH
jgi:predicted nucleic acid-binding protein